MKFHPKFILAAILLIAASPLHAATLTVTNTFDTGAGSLRQAIADAASDDIITFDAALSGSTITLAGTHLTIDKNLSIDASSLPDGIVIDADELSRCFSIVVAATDVTFEALTITGGQTGNNEFGGGVYNEGTLALQACTIHDCKTGDHGGGIYNTGIITLTNCTLANNMARNAGLDGNGGGIWSNNDATLISCTLTNNTGYNGGGILIASSSQVSLENTIVSGNTADNLGPDIRNTITTIAGVNFIGIDNGASGLGTLNTDYLKGDAMLAPLGDFGGPTPTAPPLLGSPVLDAGLTATALSTDQRGETRAIDSIFPDTSNDVPDIGAVEFHQFQVQVDSLTDLDDADFSTGNLSLREALNPANARSGTIVTFAPALSSQTLTLGSQLEITQDVTIDASALADSLTLSGNSSSRIFNIAPSSGTIEVTLRGLLCKDGNAPNGGAIYNRLDTNTSVIDCTFENNTGEYGGAIRNRGTLTLLGVTIHNNIADGSAGTTTQGGGLYNNAGGSVTMTNCTVTGNSTTNNSGGGLFNRGTLTIESSTIFENASPFGGGIRQVEGSLALSNTIVAANTTGADIQKSGGSVTITGPNLIGDNDTITTEAPADGILIGTAAAPIDPLLGTLADNGGPTLTLLPSPGSPALGVASITGPVVDQRGIARPAGAAPDLGSAETGYSFDNLSPGNNESGIARYPTFEWSQPAESAHFQRYEIYFNSGAGFQLLDDSITSHTNTTLVSPSSFPLDTLLSWRVDAIYSGGTVSSTSTSFTTRSPNPQVTVSEDQDNGYNTSGTSLREAIFDAVDGETITFDPLLDGESIELNNAFLDISRDLTIDASGLPGGITINGVNLTRCFRVNVDAEVTFKALTITGGLPPGSNANGGGIFNQGTLTLENCTIHDCQASDHGGGIYNTGTITLTNCTLANNAAQASGIDGNGGGVWSNNKAAFISCTITENFGRLGGGIFITHTSPSFTLENTIVAENTAVLAPDIFGILTGHSGVNFIGELESSSGLGTLGTDYLTGNPLLAPFGDYGGATPTAHPYLGSPVIDNAASGTATDQRNFPRPLGAAPDIGAVEVDPTTEIFAIANPSPADGATNIHPFVEFAWDAPSVSPDRYDIYLDGIFLTSLTTRSFNLALDPGMSHSWRIDTVYDSLIVTGSTNTFDTSADNPIVVDTLLDENDGIGVGAGTSLRDAITSVGTGGRAVITFAPSLDSGTITLTNGQLSIGNQRLAIDASDLPSGLTIDANGISTEHRVLNITDSSAVVHLHALTLSGGADTPSSGFLPSMGGGIQSRGSLTIRSSTISGNSTNGILDNIGGGINSSGSLSIHSSTISGNSTKGIGSGGGIYFTGSLMIHDSIISGNLASSDGGGICNLNGTATIYASTISGNTAGNFGGGIQDQTGSTSIHNSTISGNTVGGNGGGIHKIGGIVSIHASTISGNTAGFFGGGIHQQSGTTSIHTSTISGNTAVEEGGGIHQQNGTISIHTSTTSGNTAEYEGGGISNESGTLSIQSSIAAGNFSEFSEPNIFGSYSGSENLIDVDPLLAPLGNYGGPTPTMPPLPGSPAIDAAGSIDPGGTDQRGLPRFANGALDIGAVEIQNSAESNTILTAAWPLDSDGDTLPFGLEFALGTEPHFPDPNSPWVPSITPAVGGGLEFTFGFNPTAAPYTAWVVMRTTDLDHSQATEIYRLNGPNMNEITVAGVSAVITADQITITDATPPAGNQVFYYLGAIQQ